MKRPQPRKHSECEHCLRDMPLLMPVALIPGWPIVVWVHLCIDCRLSLQMSKHRDRYCEPGEMWKFHQCESVRQTYDKWLLVEQL